MKLATFLDPAGAERIGAVFGNDTRVLDLATAARRVGIDSQPFASMLTLMASGPAALDVARTLLAKNDGDETTDRPLESVTLLSPVPVPTSIRDFVAFPGHITGAPIALRALHNHLSGTAEQASTSTAAPEIPPVYRRIPNYYKGNRFTVIGDAMNVTRPQGCEYLDYELEFGIFIGTPALDAPRAQARDHIFGYAIFNDFSARDFQVREMGGMTGPCKSKDFETGNAIGPWIITADEIADPYSLKMTSRVNGETWCANDSSGMLHSFEDMIAFVSRDERLHTGEFFGSGTVGGGTGMEINRFLKDGDLIELEVEGLGVLRNRITSSRSH
jgi:2-keto-4-pentenoate hydratase/2-oxohepta-3-ene-1,7-dioic acid hydratase in catechol pathway